MGTILKREAKQVVTDLMVLHKVPKSVWSVTPGGELHFMIGPRVAKFHCASGLSYYALRALTEQVEAAIRDYFNQPDRRQVDIEEAIKSQPASAAA